MSLFKRKASSLDPVQKQRKFKQTEYYALLDRCSQIPSDDKLIVRKNIEQSEEGLISLLEKYRKEGPKDLQDLQIYLRKYIQKYKNEHPKYPTLKFIRSTQSCLSLQKPRNSIQFSVNQSKVSLNVNSTISVQKSSYHLPRKGKNSSSTNLTLASRTFMNISKQEQRNYEKMIKKRKTQKLKISQNRVSVTIQNESHKKSWHKQVPNTSINQSHLTSLCKQHQTVQNESKFLKESINESKNYESLKIENVLLINSHEKLKNKNEVPFQTIQKVDFLETMRFRMKVDQTDENQQEVKLFQQFPFRNVQPSIIQNKTSKQSLNLNMKESEFPTFQQEKSNQIKRKLFEDKHQSIRNSFGDFSQQLRQTSSKISQRSPLAQLNIHQQSFHNNKSIFDESKLSNKKENFNSGKNRLDIQKVDDNKNPLAESVKKNESSMNINSLSTINNENEQNQILSLYLKSQRKKSQLLSHRLIDSSRKMIQSFSKNDKQNESIKSSRMPFSHRMQEVISGRTDKQQQDKKGFQKSPLVSQSYSFRQKKKGDSKLEFWARIQSTINQ